jgi:tRNA(Ile)-lysidine synthase
VARRIAVAVSGGRDSTALWHATAHAAATHAPPVEVVALHVHHGLQEQADEWLAHLRRQARRWAASGLPVSFDWRRLQGAPARGDSVEAWARRERYAALAEMARAAGIHTVLLAHHQQDQAETYLLQALRGAGAAGLAAMPVATERGGIHWLRPWLSQPARAIEHYVRRHRLRHVEDPSNRLSALARNRLRLGVMPALIEHFEHAVPSLCASAARAHEAQLCLNELARLDLATLCPDGGALRIDLWRLLSPARRGNALRVWLDDAMPHGVAQSLIDRLKVELMQARPARWPLPGMQAGTQLGLYDDRLSLVAAAVPSNDRPALLRIDLSRPGRHPVAAWRGAFLVTASAGVGLDPQRLRDCELRERAGGEVFQRSARAVPRSLKKQFQVARVPQWSRGGPLVFSDGQLLFVPGLGIDARRLAAPAARALQLRWVPEPGG